MLKPDLYYRSIADVDLDDLKSRGVGVLLLDLDNTLVPRNTTDAASEVRAWVDGAKEAGFQLVICSNNWHERVQEAAAALAVPIMGKGTKPFPAVFRRALEYAGCGPSASAVIGDQVFTDILGGKLIGATTVLVMPLAEGTDLPHTRILRALERFILRGLVPAVRRPTAPGGA